MRFIRRFYERLRAAVISFRKPSRPRFSNLYDRAAVEAYCDLLEEIDRDVNNDDKILSEIDVFVTRAYRPTVIRSKVAASED